MRFSEVLGQQHIKNRLAIALQSNRLAHAQLFVGPDGCGCLPMALALSRAVLCNPKEMGPEAQKVAHLKMDHLNHPDLHFVFPVATSGMAKSKPISDHYATAWREFISKQPYGNSFDWYQNIGTEKKQGNISVEEAKEITQKLALKAYEGGYKIMIIWGVEKMNTAAANKLLKLLEEPPEKTLFILITETEEQLLDTIKSRCQVSYFKKLSEQDIIESLIKKGAEESVAKQIALSAQGNFNKALGLYNKNTDTVDFGTWFVFWVRAAFKAKGNKGAINELISWGATLAKTGRETQKNFLQYALALFREALLINYGLAHLNHTQVLVSGFDFKKFTPFIHHANTQDITAAVEKAIYEIERNGNAKMIFTDLAIQLTRLIHIPANPAVKS